MASTKNAGRRRFITREHTSDTSEADASTVRTPEEECERRRLENVSLPRDTPSAFVRVKPSSKSSTSDWTFRESKNGLVVPSSRRLPQQPLVPVNSEPNNAQFHATASEKISQQPLIYTPLETGLPPECDSLSLGFRPIRRDSLGSTSSSLAGSTVDSELTISNAPPDQLDSPQRLVKLPPHPSGKDFTDGGAASKLRPWSYYDSGMLMPRTVLSSTGSAASSYDNLDKMDSLSHQRNGLQVNSDEKTQAHPTPSPRFARSKHFDGSNARRTPSPPSGRRHVSPFRSDDDRQFHAAGSRVHGHKTGDAAARESLTMSGEDKAESAHFLEGVCRRRMAGGHVQVIPPHLVGVFDPSRFLPTSAHAPSETSAPGFMDVERLNHELVVKQPESATYHRMGKLPSKLPIQPSFIRPPESYAKSSTLSHSSGQHIGKDLTDRSSITHANPTLPFASKDSGLSTDEQHLVSTSVAKVHAGRKSYKNEDLLSKDASPKFPNKYLFSSSRKGESNNDNQDSSVTDLFHHVLPSVNASHHAGPVFHESAHYSATQDSNDSQMASRKVGAFLSTNHSSPSKQGSPKSAQTSTPKTSPKWESTSLSKGSKKCEEISSPKIRSKHDQISAAKSSPKWERTPSSAKSNLISSPKSSPKLERNAAAVRRNLKWEAPSVTSAKASQQSSCSKGISKWEPSVASKDNNARSKDALTSAPSDHHALVGFSATNSLEKTAETAHAMEKFQRNRAVSDSGQVRLHSTNTDSTRMHETPGDGGLHRSRTERDKRKGTQLPTTGTSDSVFSARRKQFPSPLSTDKVDHQNTRSGADVIVERASRSATTARQNLDEERETTMSNLVNSEVACSPSDKATLDMRNSNSPRKASDDVICHSDAASDKTSASSTTSSSFLGVEKKQLGQQKSESGESDARSGRSSTQITEVVKVSLGDDALREPSLVDVVMERGSAAAAGHDATNVNDYDDAINANNVKDFAVEDATGSDTVVAEVKVDEKEVSAGSVNSNSNVEVPPSKNKLSPCCPQTKTFTDILESIQVVTQPCVAPFSSSSPGNTPVFSPPSHSSVPFPLFDVNDEPVMKSPSTHRETLAVTPVDVSKQAAECKPNEPSCVDEIISIGGKHPVAFPAGFQQRKTEENADVVNNNSKESVQSTQTNCREQSQISSPVRDRRSLDSISSSSFVELPTNELAIDEKQTTANEPIYCVTIAQELSYPGVVQKAIFTVDKEISFVSGLMEPDSRDSLPQKVSSQTSTNVQDARHTEYSPFTSESTFNVKYLLDSAPFTFVTVSPLPDAGRETFPNVDKMPGAFHNSASGSFQSLPTVLSTSHLNLTQRDPSFTREKSSASPRPTLLTVFDSCPLSDPVNLNETDVLPNGNDNDDSIEKEKVASDLDESDDTIDPGGTESKVSTASLDQITQETEIFELAKTSAAYLKPEVASTSSSYASYSAPTVNTQEAGKSELLGTISVPESALTQNHDSAKRSFVFTTKELLLPANVNKQLDIRANASPFQPEVSPVMAALDDALAVLTSVVMENKTTSGVTPSCSAASTVRSKKETLKQDIAKAILNLNVDPKKPSRSKSTNKEGLSSSKKRVGVSHKEQHATFGSSTPVVTAPSHHSDPLEVTDTVHREIEKVENRRHKLTKEDSFNRPDSPMFHETLPLPKDSIIKRNREHCRDSSSSSDSAGSPQSSPRMAPRNLRRSKRCQDANKSGSVTTPSEVSTYRPFLGAHSSARTLSRHQSDIVLDVQSLTGGASSSHLPSAAQQLHKTRRHNSDSADASRSPWPKTVSLAQGMDSVLVLPGTGTGSSVGGRDVKRRTDRFPLPSDIQQSLLLYNQQHGARRGQSWMQAVDASVEGGGAFTGPIVHPKDKAG